MRQTISNIADVKQKIEAGRKLLLAGDEDALRQLPKGDWIAGTIPYFISSEQGGLVSRDLICATDITDVVTALILWPTIRTAWPRSTAKVPSTVSASSSSGRQQNAQVLRPQCPELQRFRRASAHRLDRRRPSERSG